MGGSARALPRPADRPSVLPPKREAMGWSRPPVTNVVGAAFDVTARGRYVRLADCITFMKVAIMTRKMLQRVGLQH